MSRITHWLRTGRVLGILLLAGLLVLRILDPAPVERFRNAVFDLYQQTRPRTPAPLPVSIIDIDDASLAELGQWPWPRTRVARIVEEVAAQGALALAFDIVFAEPDRLSPGRIQRELPNLPQPLRSALSLLPDNEEVLADAMARMPVVVGQASIRSASVKGPKTSDISPVPHALVGPDPMPFLLKFPEVVQNVPAIEAAAAGRGVFSIRPDPDGIYRRVPLVMSLNGQIRLALTPELLRVAAGGQAFAIRSNEAGIDGIILGGQFIRTDENGRVWPYFSEHSPARYVSAADLLAGRVAPGRLTGHLVILGTSAIGLGDFRPTPLGVPMAGAEIHAQLLENVLSGSLLKRPNYAIGAELVTVTLLSLAIVVLVPILGAVWVIALSLLLLGGYLALSYGLFLTRLSLLDASFPAFAIVVTMIVMASANYVREERDRRRIRSAFGQYVSPDLVEELQRSPEGLQLGGEARELTVLFTDVRGFTGIAETYRDRPEALTEMMNGLLTVLSRAVLDHGGTIDKFMGDAVMAFWNAPLDHPDPERAAAAAALAMQAGVSDWNAARALAASPGAPAPPALAIGVGINTGLCTVGNMGSDMRFDYTAIGDPVNLASRLEGQSRVYGLGIIVGQSTARALGEDFAILEIDLLRVRGKQEPQAAFALLGGATLRNQPGFAALDEANAAMLRAYRAQRPDDALAALARIAPAGDAIGLDLAAYTAHYAARIADLRRAPPGDGWDGARTAEAK